MTPERAASLKAYLGKDPAEARRVAFYGRLNVQIRQAFQTIDEPVKRRAAGWRRTLDRGRLKSARPRGRPATTLAILFLILVV